MTIIEMAVAAARARAGRGPIVAGDPPTADPRHTGVRAAYRAETYRTNGQGYWVPSRLLVAMHQPQARQTEAMCELRSQLMLRWFSHARNSLVVTGGRTGDGCSVVAGNLAVVLAQLGEPTLLIDANFRTPRQHELFAIAPEFGLADLLRGRDVFAGALTVVPSLENLQVLCAGSVPPNPQELLSRASFAYVLKALAARYRAIVIDTPPVLTFADAQMVAARAQGCLLVTRRHYTRLTDVEQIKGRLEPTRVQLLGAIINE